jgi:hypothetical protein
VLQRDSNQRDNDERGSSTELATPRSTHIPAAAVLAESGKPRDQAVKTLEPAPSSRSTCIETLALTIAVALRAVHSAGDRSRES